LFCCRLSRWCAADWNRNGFWLLLKWLEEDRVIWPSEEAVPALTVEQLHWLLEGMCGAAASEGAVRAGYLTGRCKTEPLYGLVAGGGRCYRAMR
jgi:hypothetical protein